MVCCFTSYLSGQRQFVIVEGSGIWSTPGICAESIAFLLYTSPHIIHKHNVTLQFYASDSQIYMNFKPSIENGPLAEERIESSFYTRHCFIDACQHAQAKAEGSPDYFFSRIARRSAKSNLTFAFEDHGVWDTPRCPAGKETIFQNDTVCSYIFQLTRYFQAKNIAVHIIVNTIG